MQNPFRSGSKFGIVFGKMMELGTFTKKDLVKFAEDNGAKNPNSTVSMLLSPREGDKFGNPAVKGNIYYVVKNKKTKKEDEFTYTLYSRDNSVIKVEEVIENSEQIIETVESEITDKDIDAVIEAMQKK